jgi:hypothetical protein
MVDKAVIVVDWNSQFCKGGDVESVSIVVCSPILSPHLRIRVVPAYIGYDTKSSVKFPYSCVLYLVPL